MTATIPGALPLAAPVAVQTNTDAAMKARDAADASRSGGFGYAAVLPASRRARSRAGRRSRWRGGAARRG